MLLRPCTRTSLSRTQTSSSRLDARLYGIPYPRTDPVSKVEFDEHGRWWWDIFFLVETGWQKGVLALVLEFGVPWHNKKVLRAMGA